MLEFKLVKEEFVGQEQCWTYSCLFTFTFKKWTIQEITITDYYQKKPGRKMITKELILNIFQTKLNGRKRLKPLSDSYRLWKREIFPFETTYQGKKYRLFFWFKDGTDNHLWVRNIFPIE